MSASFGNILCMDMGVGGRNDRCFHIAGEHNEFCAKQHLSSGELLFLVRYHDKRRRCFPCLQMTYSTLEFCLKVA